MEIDACVCACACYCRKDTRESEEAGVEGGKEGARKTEDIGWMVVKLCIHMCKRKKSTNNECRRGLLRVEK